MGMVDEILVYMHNHYGHLLRKLRILPGETNAAGQIITYDLSSPDRIDDLQIHRARNIDLDTSDRAIHIHAEGWDFAA